MMRLTISQKATIIVAVGLFSASMIFIQNKVLKDIYAEDTFVQQHASSVNGTTTTSRRDESIVLPHVTLESSDDEDKSTSSPENSTPESSGDEETSIPSPDNSALENSGDEETDEETDEDTSISSPDETLESSGDEDTGEEADEDTSILSTDNITSESSDYAEVLPCVTGDEPGCSTFPEIRSPLRDLEEFFTAHPDSNGARFVELLQEHLYDEPSWERERIDACYRKRDLVKCFAGMRNYNAASDEERKSQQVKMPFYEDTEGTEGSVFQAYHFQNTTKPVPYLGTHTVCMPLLLAGTTVTETGIVIELGPFAGMTSKCVGMGLKKTSPPRTNSLISYDTFSDNANYNAITRGSPWVEESYPDFTRENNDFLQIWKDIVQYEYPTAEGRKGYVSAETLSDEIVGDKNIEILMIDSAKTDRALHEQAGGITIRAGSILFLMDLEQLRPQVLQVYGCLRSGFITPIYASLGQEHWAWIVTKSFNINQPWMKKCYTNLANNPEKAREIMLQQAKDDIIFIASGLTGDEKRAEEQFEYWIDRVHTTYQSNTLNGEWDGEWAKFARFEFFNVA